MLSLSTFLFKSNNFLGCIQKKKLVKLFKIKIFNNKVDGIFKILKKCLDDFDIKKFSNVYFSSGQEVLQLF